jgi:integrase
MLSAIISWGIRRGYFTCSNPCKGVEKIKMRSRERFLMPDEISKFKRALLKESQDLQDLYWILLLTGARKSNVLSLEWNEVDTILRVWRIPPQKHKNGETQLNPLTDPVLAILDRRQRTRSNSTSSSTSSKFVFPGKGKTGHLADVKRSWARILKRAKIPDLRIHDLRRTYGSYMAINGESPYIIGKALGHIDQRSTAVYARLNLAPVRKAIEGAQGAFL